MKSTGIKIGRFGAFGYIRNLYKWRQWYILPAICVECNNGIDKSIDFEVKYLFIGVGMRIIILRSKMDIRTSRTEIVKVSEAGYLQINAKAYNCKLELITNVGNSGEVVITMGGTQRDLDKLFKKLEEVKE